MPSFEEIQASNDRTRADLAATLNELEDKLNVPKQLGIAGHKLKAAFDKNPAPWLAGASSVVALVAGIAVVSIRRR